MKHPKIHRCDLCGRRYAVLNSTWHLTPSYRKHFCRDCTTILETMLRKAKLAIQFGKENV